MPRHEVTGARGRTIGYVRVTSGTAALAEQRAALKAVGCDPILEEDPPSKAQPDPQRVWHGLLNEALRPGDTLVVTQLRTAVGSLRALLELVASCARQQIAFHALAEGLETASPVGPIVCAVLRAVATFDRAVTHEHQAAGLASARRRGIRLGRPPRFTPEQVRQITAELQARRSVREVAALFGTTRQTIYRLCVWAPRGEHSPPSRTVQQPQSTQEVHDEDRSLQRSPHHSQTVHRPDSGTS